MQNTRKKSRKGRAGKFFGRRNGEQVSWNKILFIQSISAIIFLTACSSIISEEGSLDVYFCPGCEDVFVGFLENYPESKCAFFDLDSERLIEVLGKSEVIVFEENYENFGSKVGSLGLMHNKFCVFEDKVITGSANPTFRGLNINYNNLVVIESETIANNYEEEFFELMKSNQERTKNTIVNLSGTLIANYFCPEDDCEGRVLEILNKAEKSIYFMTFSFTSDAIGDLILEKSKTVEVQGKMESFGLNKYSEYDKLKEFASLERTNAMLHHKVFIIDNEIVITGSYNPTKAGTEKNDENVLIIYDKEIAEKFLEAYFSLSTT